MAAVYHGAGRRGVRAASWKWRTPRFTPKLEGMPKNHRVAKVAALLSASGFCALTYQVAWMKEFRLVFGASTAASAAVLAIFIAGLGFGGLWFGPRADRTPRPLVLYAMLEVGVAVTAALSPILLSLVRAAYVAVGGSTSLGSVLGTGLRLLLAALVLAVPTFLMGGTLPAAARAVESAEDAGRRRLAWLYGLNTLGAVVGTFLANFFLLEIYGTRNTLWLACLVNVLVAVLARKLGNDLPAEPVEAPASGAVSAVRASGRERRFVFVAAALMGFAFFLMELVWYRMLGPILGGTIFTFGLILAVALLGIGVGGVLYASFGEERPATLRGFAISCLLEAVAVALPLALGDRLAVLALLLRPLGDLGLFGHVLGWSAICSVVVFPAAVVSGYQFPLLIALLGRGREAVGREVGVAYAWNTAGAIAGALAGGFGLLPALSAPGCWRLTAVLLCIVGVVAAGLDSWRAPRWTWRLAAPALLAALTAAMLFADGPSAVWRHGGIGAGRATLPRDANERRNWTESRRRQTQWERDGVESAVALNTAGAGGYAFVVNGKTDGSARLDASTQLMGGFLGALLLPAPRRALVIGLGTGTTAGWLGKVPGMERVDVVELEPAIEEVARRCAAVNQRVLENPKVRIHYGDAREVLLTSRERYDIIFSEPSNPYRAGIASLFTREFYEIVRSRLAPGGLFLQWVQAYEVDGQTLRTVYATVGGVFPEVETWRLHPVDLLLVASEQRVPHDVPALRGRVAEEPYKSALAHAWRVAGIEGLFAHWLAGNATARAVVNAARALGQERPDVQGGDVDWEKVLDERLAVDPVALIAPRPDYDPGRTRSRRSRALTALVSGELTKVEAIWAGETRRATTFSEIAMLAESGAVTGAAGAEERIAQLKTFSPLEGEVVQARLRFQRDQVEEAAKLLAAALVRYRTDPWPDPAVMQRAVRLAPRLAEAKPAVAPILYQALRQPFAVGLVDDARLSAALWVARQIDQAAVVDALSALEPNVPWNRPTLTMRAEAYRSTRHPLARRAANDLAELIAAEPPAFRVDVPARPALEMAGPSEPQ